MFLSAYLTVHLTALAAARHLGDRLAALRARPDQRGQASAEYALVLLGCAAVAILVTAWATKTNKIGKLFDAVMETVLDKTK